MGVGKRPYTFAWILGFVITSLVYVVLSSVFPPKETMISRAVLPDEVYEGEEGAEGGVVIEGKGGYEEDVEGEGGKKVD